MSGQGAKVLARRTLNVVPAKVTLNGPAEAAAGSVISVEWTGPKNPGDTITVVPKSAKDGTVLQTSLASRGSPAKVTVPGEAGAAEIRYTSGQGNRVLARQPIELTPAK